MNRDPNKKHRVFAFRTNNESIIEKILDYKNQGFENQNDLLKHAIESYYSNPNSNRELTTKQKLKSKTSRRDIKNLERVRSCWLYTGAARGVCESW